MIDTTQVYDDRSANRFLNLWVIDKVNLQLNSFVNIQFFFFLLIASVLFFFFIRSSVCVCSCLSLSSFCCAILWCCSYLCLMTLKILYGMGGGGGTTNSIRACFYYALSLVSSNIPIYFQNIYKYI